MSQFVEGHPFQVFEPGYLGAGAHELEPSHQLKVTKDVREALLPLVGVVQEMLPAILSGEQQGEEIPRGSQVRLGHSARHNQAGAIVVAEREMVGLWPLSGSKGARDGSDGLVREHLHMGPWEFMRQATEQGLPDGVLVYGWEGLIYRRVVTPVAVVEKPHGGLMYVEIVPTPDEAKVRKAPSHFRPGQAGVTQAGNDGRKGPVSYRISSAYLLHAPSE